MLQRGDKGTEVIELQNALNASASGKAISVDGDFGPATETALKNYQSIHGLAVTGIADDKTLKELGIKKAFALSLPSIAGHKISMPVAFGIVGVVAIAAILYRNSRSA